ncbi:NUDIX hydrolase [Bacillaceae bacterium]
MKEISAGGVVYREKNGELQIMLIEDRYSRISLPKGKKEAGETIEETALREIKEETGIEGEIVRPLEVIHYQYYNPEIGNVDKEVHYFLVRAVSGKLEAQVEEINGVQWLSPNQALRKQLEKGYANNTAVLKKAFAYLGVR